MLWTNKMIDAKIVELNSLIDDCKSLIETIKTYHKNGACLLLEDLNEVVISKLQSLAQDDKVIVLFTKDGKRIEIHQQQTDTLASSKKKSLFNVI